MEDHESGRCNYLREATAEEQRIYLLHTVVCPSCLEWEEQNLQHSCNTSGICTKCDDPHHSIIKCEVFPLTQISEPTSEAEVTDAATVEENDDKPLTREDPEGANPPTQPTNQQQQKGNDPVSKARAMYTKGLHPIRKIKLANMLLEL